MEGSGTLNVLYRRARHFSFGVNNTMKAKFYLCDFLSGAMSANLVVKIFEVNHGEVELKLPYNQILRDSHYHEKKENDQRVEAQIQNMYQLSQHQRAKQDAGKRHFSQLTPRIPLRQGPASGRLKGTKVRDLNKFNYLQARFCTKNICCNRFWLSTSTVITNH